MHSELMILYLLFVRDDFCECGLSGYRDSGDSELLMSNVLRVIGSIAGERVDVTVHPGGVLESVPAALWSDARYSVTLRDAPAHCYLFVVSAEDAEEALSGYRRLRTRARVVVATTEPAGLDALAVFATLQRRGMYDVVVVSTQGALTWRPFSNETSCGRPDPGNVVPWREGDSSVVVVDLRGCEVVVTTLVWPPYVTANYSDGLEIRVLRTLAAAANFSVRFREPSNGDWYASYRDVSLGLTDIAMGSLMGISRLFTTCDPTIFYLTEAIQWAIPRPARLPRWRSLSLAFETDVWAALAAILVCTVATLRVLGERDVSRAALLTAWPTLLGTSGQALAAPSAGRRVLFAAWALYCLLVDTAFTSVLVGILVDPGREPRFRDEQQLMASHMAVGYSEGMDSILGDGVRGRGEYCNDYEACLDRVAFRGDFAFVVLRRFVTYVSKKRYETKKEPLFYTFYENIITSGITMYFTKGHPALPRVNALLWRVLNAGLFSAWEEDLSRKVTLSAIATERNSPNVILTLEHFQSAFQLLAIGSLLSAIAFILEILVHKRRLRKQNATVIVLAKSHHT